MVIFTYLQRKTNVQCKACYLFEIYTVGLSELFSPTKINTKLQIKKKRNPKYKEQYQKTKAKLQNEMRNSFWRYIENMIFDIEINEPDQPSFKNTPIFFILI